MPEELDRRDREAWREIHRTQGRRRFVGLIRRFVVAFFVLSGVVAWLLLAIAAVERGPTWWLLAYVAGIAFMALICVGPDIIRAAGRR